MAWTYEIIETKTHPTSQEVTLWIYSFEVYICKRTWFFYPTATPEAIDDKVQAEGTRMDELKAAIEALPIGESWPLDVPKEPGLWTGVVVEAIASYTDPKIKTELYKEEVKVANYTIIPVMPDDASVEGVTSRMSMEARRSAEASEAVAVGETEAAAVVALDAQIAASQIIIGKRIIGGLK